MTYFHSIILGIVEALTEFLPVSSTGHLILASHFLGLENSDFNKAFEVVIQGGTVLAVIFYYRKSLIEKLQKFFKGNQNSKQFFINVLVAFLPSAFVGLLFHKKIKEFLFGPLPVVGALIVGGLAIILFEKYLKNKKSSKNLESMSFSDALCVGLYQCLSLWPGTSRAMTTLLGARLRGLNTEASAEFSFMLAIPTLLAATLWDLRKMGPELFSDSEKMKLIALGSLVSFVFALLVIHWFLGFVKRNSLEIFGWYRILVGIVLAYFLL